MLSARGPKQRHRRRRSVDLERHTKRARASRGVETRFANGSRRTRPPNGSRAHVRRSARGTVGNANRRTRSYAEAATEDCALEAIVRIREQSRSASRRDTTRCARGATVRHRRPSRRCLSLRRRSGRFIARCWMMAGRSRSKCSIPVRRLHRPTSLHARTDRTYAVAKGRC